MVVIIIMKICDFCTPGFCSDISVLLCITTYATKMETRFFASVVDGIQPIMKIRQDVSTN
jgi:hypothetical protein